MMTKQEEDILTLCDVEPIHLIGSIQNYGYVVGVKLEDSGEIRIVTASENFNEAHWISVEKAEELLNHSIEQVFESPIAIVLSNLVHRYLAITGPQIGYDSGAAVRNFSLLQVLCKGVPVHVRDYFICCSVVGSTNNLLLLELEELDGDQFSKISVPHSQILQSGDIVSRIRAQESIESVVSTFCDAVMKIIPGFDRGMVYRFGGDMSGEVIYETVREASKIDSSYLNLRFPAGDIPLIARQLYMKNGFRFIVDVDGSNSALISRNNEPVDLTMSFLRSVAPPHLQYLHNMGVKASMSIAIVVQDQLWGLYSLHSYTGPVKPTVEQRILLEMIGSISSMRIDAFLREVMSARKLRLSNLILKHEMYGSIYEYLGCCITDILSVLDAHSLVVYDGEDSQLCFGDSSIYPTEAGHKLLLSKPGNEILCINNFSGHLLGDGAGILFYKHQSISLALIRKSAVLDVSWGGKPDKHLGKSDQERLQPRSSFALYVEKARRECKYWSTVDIELCDMFFERMTHLLHQELLNSFRQSLDLSNAECMQAIQTAKENYEFFAHMSHELRTPFHGVVSSLQILQNCGEKLTHIEKDEIVTSALECGKNMLHTLNDILDVAKKRNSTDMVKSPMTISKLIGATYRTMQPIAETKCINFNLNEHPTTLADRDWKSVVFLSDPTRISQILNNFTNNALKFTNSGGSVTMDSYLLPTKEVQRLVATNVKSYDDAYTVVDNLVMDNKNAESCCYALCVSDTGSGVSPEDLRTMFDAYKEVSSGVEKTFQGTGLGLHIVHLHMNALKGKLVVASSLGKGTMFMCIIPVELVVEQRESIVSTVTSSAHRVSKRLSTSVEQFDLSLVAGAEILVVDDSSVNLRLSKRKLQMALGEDVKIHLAMDGFEAIDAVKKKYEESTTKKAFALILMDYHMPKCSGLDAIIGIRHLERDLNVLHPVPIIAFTADMSGQSTDALLLAGANDVLPKPTEVWLL